MEEKAFKCHYCNQDIVRKHINKRRLPRYCSPICYKEHRKVIPQYIEKKPVSNDFDVDIDKDFAIHIKMTKFAKCMLIPITILILWLFYAYNLYKG